MPGYPVPARCVATLILAFLALTGLPFTACAAVLNVPSQYATIGAAVSAASDGDTIVLAPGTYNANGDLNLVIAKSLTFEASDTAADTIIDCNVDDEFIEELDSDNLNLTFQNLTIQNCDETPFNLDDSSSSTFTFNGCVFTNIFGEGGIDTDETDTVNIAGCTMDNDSADLLDIELGTITISNSDFENDSNVVLYANSSTGTVSNCTFSNDGSPEGNGPITWLNAPLTITDSSFTDDVSNDGGGAITIDSAGLNTPVTLNRCLFSGNSTGGYGGGAVLMFEGSHNIPFTATDCVFLDNSSSTDGAVIAATSPAGAAGSITLTNCSFYGNGYTGGSASGQGVIAGDSLTPLTITNSILYGDTTPNEISTSNPPSSATIGYSDIDQSGYSGVDGNIDADPLYAAPGSGDLHIPISSPCAGTGTTTGAPATDFSQYVWGNTVSMGAHSPVQFMFTTPANAAAGSAFPFSVTATAADDTTTITNFADTVHFTSSDAAASLPADTTLTNGTATFNATLNTEGSQTITATDTVSPSITGTSNEIIVSVSQVLHTFPAGLQMISAPADYTGFTLGPIFTPGPVNLAAWQPLMNAYAVTPTSPADTVRPGQGYWVRFAGTTMLLDLGRHVDPTKPFSISLSRGWNMIGDPFATDIPLSQVQVVVKGIAKPFPLHSTPGDPVMERLYTFPAGAPAYQVETEALRSYAGYWLYAREDCTLVVNPGH